MYLFIYFNDKRLAGFKSLYETAEWVECTTCDSEVTRGEFLLRSLHPSMLRKYWYGNQEAVIARNESKLKKKLYRLDQTAVKYYFPSINNVNNSYQTLKIIVSWSGHDIYFNARSRTRAAPKAYKNKCLKTNRLDNAKHSLLLLLVNVDVR